VNSRLLWTPFQFLCGPPAWWPGFLLWCPQARSHGGRWSTWGVAARPVGGAPQQNWAAFFARSFGEHSPPSRSGPSMIKRFWRAETAIFLGIWLVLMVAGRNKLFGDPGSFWHIVVGQRILDKGELIHSDPF